MVSATLVSSLILAACSAPAGNTSTTDGSAQEGTSQVADATSTVTDPKEQFVGEWKLASMSTNGVTVTGDFSMMMGSADGASLTLQKDGTGTMAMGEDSGELTWELKGDDAITLTPKKDESSDSAPTTLDATYDKTNKAIVLEMKDETMTAALTFTADGKSKEAAEYDVSQAKDVTSLDQIAGDWKMCGVHMAGALVLGDASAMESMGLTGFDTSMSIAADGTMKSENSSSGDKIAVNDKGATITSELGTVTFKLLGDKNLLMDLSEAFGQGSELYVIFAK